MASACPPANSHRLRYFPAPGTGAPHPSRKPARAHLSPGLSRPPRASSPPHPPPTPTLGAGAQTSWIFWDAKPGYTYRIQVATDPSFLGLVTDKVITDAAWSLENLPAGRYHVRIQSISESGLAAEFSEARQVDTRSFVKATDGTAVLAADHVPVGRD